MTPAGIEASTLHIEQQASHSSKDKDKKATELMRFETPLLKFPPFNKEVSVVIATSDHVGTATMLIAPHLYGAGVQYKVRHREAMSRSSVYKLNSLFLGK